MRPANKNSWEAFCTFNPAAVYANNQVHLLYRSQGHDYVSQIGYARSRDGLCIDERLNQPAYRPSQPFEGFNLPSGDPNGPFASGGVSGGCEDPRATIIDDRVYMTYVAYNGHDHPRIAMTSIDLQDFLAQKFLWTKPVLISRSGEVNKSACIFPEKINGKYVIMHRVFPNILIDYVDSLDFTGQEFLTGQHKIETRSREWWDSRKVGAGAPPLKTKEGWLLIYQAVDDKDASQYKVWAMLLDLNDHSKVLYRSSEPILSPKESYENHGFKTGVVYPYGVVNRFPRPYRRGVPAGSTLIDDQIYMFYTAYDSVSPPCVAMTHISVENFRRHHWLWSEPIVISDLGHDNKNACLFPEKINDKYVMLHRAAGRDIAVDFLNSLNSLAYANLEKTGAITPREDSWDSAKIGIAGPPIKTKRGWLLIYHGVSRFDRNYRLGFMLLDLQDPFRVLYRSPYQILEPEYDFEKYGIVNNVVFSCGAMKKDDTIYLLYGGADKVMAVATMSVSKLLSDI